MKYFYDNKEFYSLKELAEYTGVHVKTLTARIRKGMALDEACKKTDFRCTYLCIEEDCEKSITQICNEQSKNSDLVRNRLRYGYSIDKALNRPKKISRQGMPVVVNGVLYNSIAEALRKLGLSCKESTVRSRLRAGKTPDEAFSFDDKFK